MNEVYDMWEDILLSLKDDYNIMDISFKNWLQPLEIYSIEGNEITIMAPTESDQMGVDHIARKYGLPLKIKIAEMTGQEYELHFVLSGSVSGRGGSGGSGSVLNTQSLNYKKSNLNEKYTFDTFVVGRNNQLAQSAALAVAESPGDNYNPLFIYGEPGLGKTHLMHSIGNYVLQQNPNKKVLYVTSENFVNEVIESIRSKDNMTTMSRLREKYRTVDVLMIDDIQFVIGKESTQEEFFHTFNALHSARKQIVLTSDRPPKEMETLEMRIRSRFEWGLMADIGFPDYETRMAILRKKTEDENVQIDDAILNYIADNLRDNIREIEGALNKLTVLLRTGRYEEITLDIAKKELENIISPDKPREITPQLIVEIVAEHYNLTIEQMTSKSRSSQIARPRQIAMYLCKEMTNYPLGAIGSSLGGRDHSTIIHGANKIANEYNKNEGLRQQIDTIKKEIDPNTEI